MLGARLRHGQRHPDVTRVSLKNIPREMIRVGWRWPVRNCLGNSVRERSHDLAIPLRLDLNGAQAYSIFGTTGANSGTNNAESSTSALPLTGYLPRQEGPLARQLRRLISGLYVCHLSVFP